MKTNLGLGRVCFLFSVGALVASLASDYVLLCVEYSVLVELFSLSGYEEELR